MTSQKYSIIIAALICIAILCTGTVSAAIYSGGSGIEGDPYLLSNASDIVNLSGDSGNWSYYFELTNDITLVGNHTPIGNSDTQFTGNFNGSGHTISNLTVYETSPFAGFFGFTGTGANIHDIGVETSSDGIVSTDYSVGCLIGYNLGTVNNSYAIGNASGYWYVGGLVGHNYYGTVNNCSATGNITSTLSDVGGLVGYNYHGTVNNSYATGNVSGSSDVGGLIGYNYYGTVSNSYATGNATGVQDVGGLVGMNAGGTVNNCSATGNITSTGDYIGGLIGYNDGTVSNSYATGNATGVQDVGGLVGRIVSCTVSNCYATGDVTGSYVGGLVGNMYSSTVSNCYATGDATGSYVGGLVGMNQNSGIINNCFATGTATGSSTGGIVGFNDGTVNSDCYYSGSPAIGIGTSTSFANFTNFAFVSGSSGLYWNESGNNITTADDSSFVWKIIDGYTLPFFQYQDTPAPLAPYVETISQSSGANYTDDSTSFWINVTGCSFNITDTVFVNLTMDGQTPVTGTIDSLTRTYTTINATFDLTQAIAGEWSLYVINPDGQISTAKTFAVVSLTPENFTNMTGNFWVNHTWNAATGTVTDSYNVTYNGTWLNGTTNNYYNHTLFAHAWSNITVYAYNTTYSALSNGVTDNVQVPNNEINILNITDITTNEGESISFDINYTDADGDTPTFGCNQSSLFDNFNTSTGEGSWDVGFSDSGTYYVEFNVSDGYGSVDSQVITITVANTPIIYVGNDSSYDFSSIQAAINDASEGDTTIIVNDGTYTENVDVNKSVILRSENGAESTIIIANVLSDYIFDITVDNVTIDAFNVTGAVGSGMSGIHVYTSDNNTITNNICSFNFMGIYIDCSANNTLLNNLVNDNIDPGIYLDNSANNTLTNNTAINNSCGFLLDGSNNNILTNNTANDNSQSGIYLYNSANNTLINNLVNDNIDPGILLDSSYNNTLTNNTAINNPCGILLGGSNSNTLTDNTAINSSDTGIYLDTSYSNTLTGNTANNNTLLGIYLITSDLNTLTGNTIYGNLDGGIVLFNSCTNTLENNIVTDNDGGIILLSPSNVLTNNTAINNAGSDIWTYDANIINNLKITENDAQISFVTDSTETIINGNDTISTVLSGKININDYLTITRAGSSLNITLSYDDSGMSSTVESSIALYEYNNSDSTWIAVSGTMLNTSTNQLTVTVNEGTFGLFKNPEPATTTTSSSSGTRASVSQGQNPEIVSTSASSVIRVTGGTEVNYDFSESGTPVLGVSFDAKNDEGLVAAKVQVLSSAPEGVPSPSGNSYQMMSIDVGSEGTISSDSADNVMIHFKVSKQWIEEHNIDVSTIRMSRYHGEQWNDLPTSQESEDGEYFYFCAETPGFSVFNVVGDEIGATSEQASESSSIIKEVEKPVEEEEETSDTPGFTALAGIVFVSLAFLVSRKQK